MQNPDQNPDDALATETIEHRRQVEAADARFRATLRRDSSVRDFLSRF
jgi:hypothetical protein